MFKISHVTLDNDIVLVFSIDEDKLNKLNVITLHCNSVLFEDKLNKLNDSLGLNIIFFQFQYWRVCVRTTEERQR